MAIIKSGILGGFSGKVANVVGSSWKGIAVMKSLPLSVANPRTALQVAHRNKFKRSVAFALAILSVVIKPLWDRFAQGESGFNAFISKNINLFGVGDLPSPLADLSISSGRMEKTEMSAHSKPSGTSLKLDWINDTGQGFKLEDDIPYVVVVNETTKQIQGYALTAKKRTDITVTVTVPGNTASNLYSVYLSFRRADGTVVSNTAYRHIA